MARALAEHLNETTLRVDRPRLWARLVGQYSPARRSAFTLLEIILAMSLSVILLAALYAVLKLHLTYAQKAPEQVQKTLQARAIVDRIARDIRAVVQATAMPASSSSSAATTTTTQPSTSTPTTGTSTGSATANSSNTNSTTTSEPSSNSTGTTDAYRAAYGVLGGTDWLELYVADSFSSLDDVDRAASTGSVAQTCNVLRVTYTLTVLSTRPDSKGRTQRLALTRAEVASVGAERLDSSADDADVRATTTYLSDNVAAVQFQYWDDVTLSWLDSWGTDVPIAPPRAIKVLVSLQDPDEYGQVQLGLSTNQSTWEPSFQMVVPIATWVSESETSSSSSGM